MKSLPAVFATLFVALMMGSPSSWGNPAAAANPYLLQTGDIVFEGTAGQQSDAIREATASPFTHCGVVFMQEGRVMVLEAVQPVRMSSVEQFIARSAPGTFHARRLKAAPLQAAIDRAWQWGSTLRGRDYDALFRWDDEKLYCSELVWKVFQHAGIELCPRRHFRDYHLDAPGVKKLITERYGGVDKLPADEWVVAPADLAASPLLREVPRR